jgi:hypothetical protein
MKQRSPLKCVFFTSDLSVFEDVRVHNLAALVRFQSCMACPYSEVLLAEYLEQTLPPPPPITRTPRGENQNGGIIRPNTG